MDYLDTLLGAGIAGVFWLLGRRGKRPYIPKRVEAICGCGHHRSYHKDDGPCDHDDYGQRTYWNHIHCTCQNYRGPKPYSEVMDEELS